MKLNMPPRCTVAMVGQAAWHERASRPRRNAPKGWPVIPAWVFQAMPYVLAFLLAVAIPLCGTLQYRASRLISPDTRLIVLLSVIALGALLTVALTPRTLNEHDVAATGKQLLSEFGNGFVASRYLNIFLVGVGFVEMVRGWISSRASAVPDPARPILFGLIAFYIGTILIQALGSEHPDFSYKSFYVPIVLLAVYYQRATNIHLVVEVAKLAILALMVTSLAAMFIVPDFVLHRPHKGFIPGVDFRLFGLTPHANALGPVALIGIMLELHSPSRYRMVRVAQLLMATAVLVLAQSKTAWVAAAMVVIFVVLPLAIIPNRDPSRQTVQFRRAVFTLVACIGFAIGVCAAFAAVDVFDYLERTASVDTLSGRTEIWNITLQAWRENPLFGYGREIWGIERMTKFNMFHVGQAHNQIVQTLGEAGLAGLVLLMAYLLTLLRASLRQFFASGGIAFGLLVVVLSRCVTEAPLRLDGVLSWPTFTLVVMIMLTCHYMRVERPMRERRRPPMRIQQPLEGRSSVNPAKITPRTGRVAQ